MPNLKDREFGLPSKQAHQDNFNDTPHPICGFQLTHFPLLQAFFGHSLKNSKWRKTKNQAQKSQNSNLWNKFNNFCLKSGDILQKLKNLPKTQGEMSKNPNFPVNPLPSIRQIIVQKKPTLL